MDTDSYAFFIYGDVNGISKNLFTPARSRGVCPAGSYRVELRSKANGAGSAAKVYAPSYPCVEVLAVSAPENVRIGAAELEAIAIPFDPKTFLLRAYLMTNLADGIFLGHARPVIADEACTPVTYAGDDVLMERIDPQGLLSDPVGLVCDIPKSLANGNYKLCVGVKGLGGSEYLLAEFYDMFLPDQNQGQPISLPLEVYDDCVVVRPSFPVTWSRQALPAALSTRSVVRLLS